MKKTAAILLLGVLLFNWVGYRFLTSYLEERATAQMNARLDENQYDESELITVKIPNNLPYTNFKQFQRMSGVIEIAGVQYNFVKVKVTSDSVELYCIPNHDLTKVQQTKNDFFKLNNDLQQNNQGKKSNNQQAAKSFSPDLYTMTETAALRHPGAAVAGILFADYTWTIPSSCTSTAEQPPELC